MKINKSIETPQGTVQFQGELSSEELDFVISAGLNFLMGQGIIPFKIMSEANRSDLSPGSETEQ